jgi:hypothetical protein
MIFSSDTETIELLNKYKWTMSGKFAFFSPCPYGECTPEERDAIVYLLDEYDFSYGGKL